MEIDHHTQYTSGTITDHHTYHLTVWYSIIIRPWSASTMIDHRICLTILKSIIIDLIGLWLIDFSTVKLFGSQEWNFFGHPVSSNWDAGAMIDHRTGTLSSKWSMMIDHRTKAAYGVWWLISPLVFLANVTIKNILNLLQDCKGWRGPYTLHGVQGPGTWGGG